MKKRALIFAFLLAIVANNWAAGASIQENVCPTFQAPVTLSNSLPLGVNDALSVPKTWGATNHGVVVNGYVHLKANPDTEVGDGIDLSYWNFPIKKGTPYDNVKHCPPAFVIIRVEQEEYNPKPIGNIPMPQDVSGQDFAAKVLTVEKRFSNKPVTIIPYYLLTVGKWVTPQYITSLIGNNSNATVPQSVLNHAYNDGKAQADDLLGRLRSAHINNLNFLLIGDQNFGFVAVDIEDKLAGAKYCPLESDLSKPACLANVFFGQLYSSKIRGFYDVLHGTDSKLLLLMYTSPSVYDEFLQYSSLEEDPQQLDFNLVSTLPIWVAQYTSKGTDVTPEDSEDQALCYNPQLEHQTLNRCIFHQYTTAGELGVDPVVLYPEPWHIDLDREFPIRTGKSISGTVTYYIRAN